MSDKRIYQKAELYEKLYAAVRWIEEHSISSAKQSEDELGPVWEVDEEAAEHADVIRQTVGQIMFLESDGEQRFQAWTEQLNRANAAEKRAVTAEAEAERLAGAWEAIHEQMVKDKAWFNRYFEKSQRIFQQYAEGSKAHPNQIPNINERGRE